MTKCCCKIQCSASGEEYEVKDAAARSSIVTLEADVKQIKEDFVPVDNRIKALEENQGDIDGVENAISILDRRITTLEETPGGNSGNACTYGVGYLTKSSTDASTPVRINASDLKAENILQGSKVTLHFSFSSANSLPGFIANFGNIDISNTGTNTDMFSPPPAVNMYYYTLECFFIGSSFVIYKEEQAYTASYIEMGIIGETGENRAYVTFFKEMS